MSDTGASHRGRYFFGVRHLSPSELLVHRLLQNSRTIALVGASPRSERHSNTVAGYLRRAGYEVVPIRPDRREVCGLPSYASLADVPRGSIDLIVIFRRRDAIVQHLIEAAARAPRAVWLPPGIATPALERAAAELGLLLVKDRCIEEAHRHAWARHGHPERSTPALRAH
jgi:predicted CoA-binding protein